MRTDAPTDTLAPAIPEAVALELREEQAALSAIQRKQQLLLNRLDLPAYDLEQYISEIQSDLVTSAMTLLRTGAMLAAIREHEGAGWVDICEQRLMLSRRQGQRMMAAALRFRERPAFFRAIQSSTKLLELVSEDDDTLDAIEAGHLADLKLDDVDRMSTRELRAALRKQRQQVENLERIGKDKTLQIDALARRLDVRDGGAVEERLTELLTTLDAQVIAAQAAARNLQRSAQALNELEAELGGALDPGTAERIASARQSVTESLAAAQQLLED